MILVPGEAKDAALQRPDRHIDRGLDGKFGIPLLQVDQFVATLQQNIARGL